jgi:hypothetical protein
LFEGWLEYASFDKGRDEATPPVHHRQHIAGAGPNHLRGWIALLLEIDERGCSCEEPVRSILRTPGIEVAKPIGYRAITTVYASCPGSPVGMLYPVHEIAFLQGGVREAFKGHFIYLVVFMQQCRGKSRFVHDADPLSSSVEKHTRRRGKTHRSCGRCARLVSRDMLEAESSCPSDWGSGCTHEAAHSTRVRSRSNFARPYMLRLISFSLLMASSTGPWLHFKLNPARTAASSRCTPLAKLINSGT